MKKKDTTMADIEAGIKKFWTKHFGHDITGETFTFNKHTYKVVGFKDNTKHNVTTILAKRFDKINSEPFEVNVIKSLLTDKK